MKPAKKKRKKKPVAWQRDLFDQTHYLMVGPKEPSKAMVAYDYASTKYKWSAHCVRRTVTVTFTGLAKDRDEAMKKAERSFLKAKRA